MKRATVFAVGLIAVLAVGGCSNKEEPAQMAPAQKSIAGDGQQMPADHPPMETQQGHSGSMMDAPAAGPRQVEVPEDVVSGWKAVVLQVSNKTDGSAEDVTVEIGQTASAGDLQITVQNFVPHFSMGGGSITSASNDTVNPAAQLVVTEGDAEIFSGWLFSLYPDAHPMEHETYGVILKDFVKAE